MRALLAIAALSALLAGCDDMIHQRKEGTLARGDGPHPTPPNRVQYEEHPAPAPPVTAALLARGQTEYRAVCTPCHGERGDGNGMVVHRGFSAPPSYQIARLREAPVEHFYDVITNGHGAMYSFAARVRPADRWAIAAYIRALQASQDTDIASLSPEQRAALP